MRILNIAAHPDDLDFGCAGTTARWTSEGHEVVYCLVTDGQAGGFDATISRTDMARIRRDEQTAAAGVVGVSDLQFLGFADGSVELSLDLRRALTRVIREVKPDRVVGQSPMRDLDRMYPSHPDHLAVGEATLAAVYPDARNQFAFPELLAHENLEPHTVPEVWLMGGPEPNEFVEVTDTIDKKIEALLCHTSQMRMPTEMPERIRQWAQHVAEAGGLPDGSLAEAFRTMDTR